MSLLRRREDFVHQDSFGKSDNPAGQRGNCFQTCLAAVLKLPRDEVPHFYNTDEDSTAQQAHIQRWLAERGWVCLWVPWTWVGTEWIDPPTDALFIFSGKSPRGEWGHVVLGQLTGNDWRIIHDPHPDNTGLDGTPYGFYLVAPIPSLSPT